MNRLASINVVLPVYNPPQGWETLSLASCIYLREAAPLFDWQFHFVNDGSPDSSVFDALRQQTSPFIHLHEYADNQGKGFAIRYGLQQAGHATYYMHSDWDFPFGEQLLIDAAQTLNRTAVVLANRGDEYYTHLPSMRQKISFAQRLFNKYVLNLPETDTQAGFKAFNTEGYHFFMQTRINQFLFDTEFVALAAKAGLEMKSLDVVCRKNLIFKNFAPSVLSKELSHLPKIFLARYVKNYSPAADYRLRRV